MSGREKKTKEKEENEKSLRGRKGEYRRSVHFFNTKKCLLFFKNNLFKCKNYLFKNYTIYIYIYIYI